MYKISIGVAALLAVFVTAYFLFPAMFVTTPTAGIQDSVQEGRSFDAKNATFRLEGETVTLVDGVSEVPLAPDAASKITTRYFGNEAYGDLNGDGKGDVAFLVTQGGGGSGLFYYVVVALKTGSGYQTTNAFLIGDRIAPQTTEVNESAQELRVNFAEREEGEPMTAQPSVGVTLYLKVTPDGTLEGLMR